MNATPYAQGITTASMRSPRPAMAPTRWRVPLGPSRWFRESELRNAISAPVIYGMIVPIALLDLSMFLYQAICFPIYGIARVRRGDFIVFDRHQLGYLNIIERLHCEYCAYANGLIAYMSEIVARTEQYFCPIKHAHRILGASARYERFLAYGDATDYHARLEDFRAALADGSAGPKG